MTQRTSWFLCLFVIGSLIGTLGAQPREPFTVVVFKDADGTISGANHPSSKPYAPGDTAHVAMYLPRQQDVKDADGIHISGFGFYAWRQAETAYVRVFTLIPKPGAPNRYLAGPNDNPREMLQLRDLASYTLKPGEDVLVAEMKQFGVAPVLLGLGSMVPGKPPTQP